MPRIPELFFTEGLSAVNRTISEKMNSPQVLKSFGWKMLQGMTGLPNLGVAIEEAERKIPDTGFGPTVRSLLESVNISVKIDNSEDRPEWTRQEGAGVLFYGNHQEIFEPLFLISLMDRDDISFMCASFIPHFGDNLKEHALTVLARRFTSDYRYRMNFIEKFFLPDPGITSEEAIEHNEKSIREAAIRLMNGNAVGVYPSASKNTINTRWFNGIGRILEQIPNEIQPGVLLVPVHTLPVPVFKILRNIQKRYAGGKPPENIEVSLSLGEPVSIAALSIEGKSAEEITTLLQKRYVVEFCNKPDSNPGII